tara:strand:+ start:10062 stop:10940 length:879 start_codon:yes stop_codon:yes gene_type:complete
MKGILLAGGSGSRLFPITKAVSKQLLPVYDKPMIYYSLSVLLLAGIKEILLISSIEDISNYKKLLGNGNKWGIKLKYLEQKKPNGLAEAFVIGEKFIGSDPVCLILGDNIFYGDGFPTVLKQTAKNTEIENKATIFAYHVKDPERYGVVEYDNFQNIISIEEKPKKPKSKKAVVGLYFYPNSVIEIAKQITPSDRGELEITSVNQVFLEKKLLKLELLGRGYTWLDTGQPESLMQASQFIYAIEKRQGLKVSCLEEIAYKNGWISKEKLLKEAYSLKHTEYGKYLIRIYENK